jgi:nucleoside-diphosphate-sugar epimerase
MKIFVTGGAGYLGSIIVGELLSNNHEVCVIDNFMYHQNSLANYFTNSNLTVEVGDVRDIALMKSLVSSADVIIPLAAIVGAPACDMDSFSASSTNKESILGLLDIISEDQILIMPTTNSAYGQGSKDNYCDENSSLNPLSKYAIDKVEVEKIIMSRKNSISFRLATVFGMSPRMRLDLLVNEFVLRAIRDKYIVLFEGHFKRNYIHVRDVANAFNLTLDNPQKFMGNIFNVGLSDANISKIELCEIIKRYIPEFSISESSYAKDPDQRNYIVSNSKIEGLGFKPQINLEKGIQELIKGIPTLKSLNYTNTRL